MGDEIKKLTVAELKEMGIAVRRERRKVIYHPEDGNKNAAMLLTKYRAQLDTTYKAIMRLADGHITYEDTKYPISVSEAQRDWVLDHAAKMHEMALHALETGVRPQRATEVCPTS